MNILFIFGIFILLIIAIIIGYVLGIYFPIFKSEKSENDEDQNEESSEDSDSIQSDDWEIIKNKDESMDRVGSEKKTTIQLIYDFKMNSIKLESDGKIIKLDEIKHSDKFEDVIDKLTKIQTLLYKKISPKLIDKSKNSEKELNKVNQISTKEISPTKAIFDLKFAEKKGDKEKSESIPAQIDTILQDQLKGTDLNKLGISMKEIPGQGVVFIIGMDLYAEIELVPNKEIQKAIRKAVETWEEQHAKG